MGESVATENDLRHNSLRHNNFTQNTFKISWNTFQGVIT